MGFRLVIFGLAALALSVSPGEAQETATAVLSATRSGLFDPEAATRLAGVDAFPPLRGRATATSQIEYTAHAISSHIAVVAAGEAPKPRWIRWGLIGAAAGAISFAALGRMAIDTEPNPVVQDAAFGAAAGFVILGGAVAFYDWVCAPRSRSQGAGLC